MSTIQRLQLDRQAHDASTLLANAQYQLLVIRERQLAEADREAQLHCDDAAACDLAYDHTVERIHQICAAHGLGTHGKPLEQLERISAMLMLRNDAIETLTARVAELETVAVECHGEIKALRAQYTVLRNTIEVPL